MDEPYRAEDLDYAGTIVGYKIEQRKNTTPLVRFYIEDDEYWSESFVLDISWTRDLKKMINHLESNGLKK